jgi:hypothetical protein
MVTGLAWLGTMVTGLAWCYGQWLGVRVTGLARLEPMPQWLGTMVTGLAWCYGQWLSDIRVKNDDFTTMMYANQKFYSNIVEEQLEMS